MRLIDADKYMNHLRANINTTSDTIAEQIKKDKPIGTVADGGQIGYLNALQWARASLECDCYTVQAIPLAKVIQAREEIENYTFVIEEEVLGENDLLRVVNIKVVRNILDKLIESEG